uniref:High-affinity zinc uptake system protein ZnuA n=1 Tax=Candidatus Kentrum sp. LPFa TaxID=2126335 RepID=A0A450WBI3_9GAMM|nr:MAG: zinc transport system substrate-binding protein [Candidatus Kentron sp. LPFa]VFK30171.1 MAG: zinc transport system substrate-binding protein [Candidatus Kentron sp. LPFa]
MKTHPPSRRTAAWNLLFLLCAAFLYAPWAFAGNSPRESLSVVASILPIHSLVSGVMRGIASPSLIVKGYGSPHTYRMRPSDATQLHDADLVFWIGDTLETFLRKPLASLPKTTRVIPLLKTPGLTLLKNRKGGTWNNHAADPLGSDLHSHFHAPDNPASQALGYNPHIWLDPGNAHRLARAIAQHLREIDPAYGPQYEANADTLSKRIHALDKRLHRWLSPLRGAPYLVFHDAFPYLETRYGLHAAGSITANPAGIPGARRIANLQAAIKRLGIRCVFREPQFGLKLIETVLEDADVNIGVLDPLGMNIPPGPDHWFLMMADHAEVMRDCLSSGAPSLEMSPDR